MKNLPVNDRGGLRCSCPGVSLDGALSGSREAGQPRASYRGSLKVGFGSETVPMTPSSRRQAPTHQELLALSQRLQLPRRDPGLTGTHVKWRALLSLQSGVGVLACRGWTEDTPPGAAGASWELGSGTHIWASPESGQGRLLAGVYSERVGEESASSSVQGCSCGHPQSRTI